MSGLAQRSDDPWLAALPAAVLYGAWAAYANQDGGLAGWASPPCSRAPRVSWRRASACTCCNVSAAATACATPGAPAGGAPADRADGRAALALGHAASIGERGAIVRHRLALLRPLGAPPPGSPASQRRQPAPRSSRSPSAGSARILGAFLSAQGRAIAMLEILGKASSINVRKVLWTCAELTCPTAAKTGAAASATPTRRSSSPSTRTPWCRCCATANWCSGNPTASSATWPTAMPANASIRSRRRARAGRPVAGLAGLRPQPLVELCLHEPGPAVAGAPRRGPGGGFAARLDGLHGNPRGTTATHRRLCRRRDLQPGRHRHRPVGQPLVRDAVRASVAASGARLLRAPRRPSGFLAHGRNGVP